LGLHRLEDILKNMALEKRHFGVLFQLSVGGVAFRRQIACLETDSTVSPFSHHSYHHRGKISNRRADLSEWLAESSADNPITTSSRSRPDSATRVIGEWLGDW